MQQYQSASNMYFPQWLNQNKHQLYCKNIIFNPLPFQMKSIESQKLFLLYFLVGTLKSLECSDFNSVAIIEWINSLKVNNDQNELIGFKPSPFLMDEAHIVHSYCAISLYQILESQENINSMKYNAVSILKWVYKLQNENGSIRGCINIDESDLRMVYSCLAYLNLLGILNQADLEFKERAKRYIVSCQNPDGAFGLIPNQESHGGATYCAVSSLIILGETPHRRSQLIYWLVNRQVDLGRVEEFGNEQVCGFQGRIGKQPDSCYTFWCGWTLALLGMSHLIEFQKISHFLSGCQKINGYIILSQNKYDSDRGLSKTPLNHPDPIHTLHSILGLMLENQQDKLDLLHGIVR